MSARDLATVFVAFKSRRLTCFHSTALADVGASSLNNCMASSKCFLLSERIYSFEGCACLSKFNAIPRPTLMLIAIEQELPLSTAGDEIDLVWCSRNHI